MLKQGVGLKGRPLLKGLDLFIHLNNLYIADLPVDKFIISLVGKRQEKKL